KNGHFRFVIENGGNSGQRNGFVSTDDFDRFKNTSTQITLKKDPAAKRTLQKFIDSNFKKNGDYFEPILTELKKAKESGNAKRVEGLKKRKASFETLLTSESCRKSVSEETWALTRERWNAALKKS